MKSLWNHVKKLELWLIGDMEAVKDSRQERDMDRDIVERSL